jgi:hypothetical protein
MFNKFNINKSLRSHGGKLLGLAVVITQFTVPSSLASPGSELPARTSLAPPATSAPAHPGEMLVFSPKKNVDKSTLFSLGPPQALGGEVLTGNPQIFGRFDFQEGNMRSGLFMATTGLIRVTFPFTEYATILEGKVTLTDETGKTYTYKAGESYFIRQGSVILWDVKGPYVIKAFFHISEPATP